MHDHRYNILSEFLTIYLSFINIVSLQTRALTSQTSVKCEDFVECNVQIWEGGYWDLELSCSQVHSV